MINEAVPLTFPTMPVSASQLRAGMTLLHGGQRFLAERVELNPRRVVVHGAGRTMSFDLDEEVEVRAVGRRPHFTQVRVAI
jgi:hypothetical protein